MAPVGGVILLHPIASRLGALLEAMTQERRNAPSPEVKRTVGRIAQSVEALEERLAFLEERQDFTEDLLDRKHRRELRRPEVKDDEQAPTPTSTAGDR